MVAMMVQRNILKIDVLKHLHHAFSYPQPLIKMKKPVNLKIVHMPHHSWENSLVHVAKIQKQLIHLKDGILAILKETHMHRRRRMSKGTIQIHCVSLHEKVVASGQ